MKNRRSLKYLNELSCCVLLSERKPGEWDHQEDMVRNIMSGGPCYQRERSETEKGRKMSL